MKPTSQPRPAKLKVGIIGCGIVTKISHLRWYASNPHVASICISDLLAEQRAYCEERWPIKASYQDAEEMLGREDLDVVSVCSHAQSQMRWMETIHKTSSPLSVLYGLVRSQKRMTDHRERRTRCVRRRMQRG